MCIYIDIKIRNRISRVSVGHVITILLYVDEEELFEEGGDAEADEKIYIGVTKGKVCYTLGNLGGMAHRRFRGYILSKGEIL